jgi:hypothetical protein
MLSLIGCQTGKRGIANSDKTTFGTEIEFRGRKHLASLYCAPTVYHGRDMKVASAGLVAVSLATTGGVGAVWAINELFSDQNSQPIVKQDISYALTGMGALTLAAGSGLGLYAFICPSKRYRGDMAYHEELQTLAKQLCQQRGCSVELESRKVYWHQNPIEDIHLTYPDGFKVSLTYDPNVVEVKMSPQTANDVASRQALIQRDVYDLLKKAKLMPPKHDGMWNAGYIHIGVESGFKSKQHLLNFFIDLKNHPEFGLGLLGNGGSEAKPFTHLSAYTTINLAIESLIEDIAKNGDSPINKQTREMLSSFFVKKGYAITYNCKFNTIELRFLRSQENAEVLTKVINLFNARIRYLEDKDLTDKYQRVVKASAKSKWASRFEKYISDTGLTPDEYLLLYDRNRIKGNSCRGLISEIISL